MFTVKDFQVELQNPEEVKQFVKKHGQMAAVCYNTNPKYAERVGEHCLESGHLSGSRHLFAWFTLKNIPRSSVDQLVRHYTGFVPQVQSLRYCTKDGKVSLYAAPEIIGDIYLESEIWEAEKAAQKSYNYLQANLLDAGYTKEQANEMARTVLPIGIATECNIAVNMECLIHLANLRLCTRAERPIREIVKAMVKQVVEVEPRYRPFLVPQCKKLGYCPEGDTSCKRNIANYK